MDNILPFRHPSDYTLIEDEPGNIFRYPNYRMLPDGFREILKDNYGQSVNDVNGRLNPRFWEIKRYPIPWNKMTGIRG